MAMVLDAFVGRYVDKLSEFLEGEMSMMLGVRDQIKKLQRSTKRISGFLESAEQERHQNQSINNWVVELKDVMYDADDIIDHCMIEGRILLENDPSASAVRSTSPSFFSFGFLKFKHEIGKKIKELNARLKDINEHRSMLPLPKYTKQSARETRVNPRQTFPSVIKSDIVGTKIEEATQSLVELLIKEDNKKYQVLGIVGMGGIGKTTLAANLYNNKIIEERFPIRVWVCISQHFSETKLLQEIIRGVTGKNGEAETKAELVPRLSLVLSKRFLIVLDDVWKADVWEDLLRYPFENATTSGKIVITTRATTVARSIGAEIHHVDKMDDRSGWRLLRNIVFGDNDDDDEEMSSLQEIGVKIVEKCDGLPLAIKTIGGVLRSKERSTIEWNKILKSDAWSMSRLDEKLPGSLFLSYEDLPSDLKPCFLFCSLYPEDEPMGRWDLIRYWVAEGFIPTTQGDILMEDLAEDYFGELIWRNLLEGYNNGSCCRMHDLLRSLALFLIRDESIFLGDEQSLNTNPLSKIRRLSIVNTGERVEVPDVIKQQKCLRTLLLIARRGANIVESELFGSLRLLRVLDLTDTGLESLSDSIRDLLHLRYLDLDRTKIRKLPESIGCLVNLQTLNLSGCEFLHTLPKAVTKLCNLRCLRLGGTPLTHVPKGVGKLKYLNHLDRFVVGHDDKRDTQDDEGCDLEELRSLSQLRFLSIRSLERAQPGGALVLENSRSLRTLILECKQPEDEEEAVAIQRIDKIYEDLSPRSTHLQELKIFKFFGTGFPSWMGVSFPNLTKIILCDCKSCPQLPPLGQLPQLKSLHIEGAHAIKTIGPEFLHPRAFRKLEELILSNMQNWEEWSFSMKEGVGEERSGAPKLLPHLKKLKLFVWPKLRALPEGLQHATNLQELQVAGANNLISSSDHLQIRKNESLERISNLPSLKSLVIEDCPRLKHTERLDKLQFLTVIETSATDVVGQTEHLSQWLLELLQKKFRAAVPNLKLFDLSCSLPLLKTFVKDGPNWPIIQPIPQVYITNHQFVPQYHRLYIEYKKDPPTFKTNVVESQESVD